MISIMKKNLDAAGLWLQPLAVLQGTAVACVLLLFTALGLAVVVFFSHWQAAPRLLCSLAHLAVFLGAVWAGKKCTRKAWVHGVLVGVVAFVLLGLFGSVEQSVLTWLWWKGMLRMALLAMVGGMVGGLFKSG